MTSPAGPCEWCGGPQNWTIHLGEMYVRCKGGCLPLDLEELVQPSPNSAIAASWYNDGDGNGTLEEERVVPPEGGAARVTEEGSKGLPF